MSFDFLSRTELLVSNEKLNVLRSSHVAIFGLGGIGSCAAEMLCRGGIGKLTIIDGDIVVLSNLNRQLHSLRSNLNYEKTIVLQDRLLSINPNLEVHRIQRYLKYRQDFTEIFETNSKCEISLDKAVELGVKAGEQTKKKAQKLLQKII
jgi:tRNA A37 threonylcarbamoyladenosine dehydratase